MGGSVRHLSARIRFALLLAKTRAYVKALTTTACRCCIELTICGVKLPEFTCLSPFTGYDDESTISAATFGATDCDCVLCCVYVSHFL